MHVQVLSCRSKGNWTVARLTGEDMSDLGSKMKIFIVSQSIIQNELLTQHIKSSIGCPCVAFRELDQISTDEIKGQKGLIIFDCKDHNSKIMFPNFIQRVNLLFPNCLVALLNAKKGLSVEGQFKKANIQGIFFENDSSDALIEGIRAILMGDMRTIPQISPL